MEKENNLKELTKPCPCPFCGSEDIRYSTKTTGRWKRQYHLSMYCNKCHCYGPRVLITVDDDAHRYNIENDLSLKQQAIDAWNQRKII